MAVLSKPVYDVMYSYYNHVVIGGVHLASKLVPAVNLQVLISAVIVFCRFFEIDIDSDGHIVGLS